MLFSLYCNTSTDHHVGCTPPALSLFERPGFKLTVVELSQAKRGRCSPFPFSAPPPIRPGFRLLCSRTGTIFLPRNHNRFDRQPQNRLPIRNMPCIFARTQLSKSAQVLRVPMKLLVALQSVTRIDTHQGITLSR